MKLSRLVLASFLGLSSLFGFACGDNGPSDAGDGDGDSDACSIGAEGCACTSGGSCDDGLECLSDVCVDVSSLEGDGDGDDATGGRSSGDGDGDDATGGRSSGDGDGDNPPGGAPSGDGDGDGDDVEPLVCESNEVLCDEACVDPETDNDYCGASGNCAGSDAGEACEAGYECEEGECKLQCPTDELACGDSCIDPASDNDHCGATGDCLASDAGTVCDEDSECIESSCRAPDGTLCIRDDDCISGTCSTFYDDQDGDGFGALTSGVTQICGTEPPGEGWVENDLDCCDVAATVQTAALVNPAYAGGPTSVAAEGCEAPFDYNCDGEETSDRPVVPCAEFDAAECPATIFNSEETLVCGELGVILACAVVDTTCTQVGGTQITYLCE